MKKGIIEQSADGAAAGRDADVVVIGAGLAGLTAARALERAGASVLVLEARDRVGGRLLNHDLGDGKVVELGGAYLGERQDRVAALARELGVEIFDTYAHGDAIYHRRGRNRRYHSAGSLGVARHDPIGGAEYGVAQLRLQRLARRVDLKAPWATRFAEEADALSAEDWKRAHLRSRGARALFDVTVRGILASEPRDVSLLWLLTYIRSAGDDFWGLDRLTRVRRDLRQRFVGGSQRLCEAIAAQLRGPVVLDSPVERVQEHSSGVQVATPKAEYRSKELVATMPPALLGRIEWQPSLPAGWGQLQRRAPLGAVAKVHAVFDEPFWRSAGLSGEVVSDRGPVELVFDGSPPDGRPGVLVGFILGDHARSWSQLDPTERSAAALGCLERYFGAPVRAMRHYVEKAWPADPWACGCYGTVLPRGVATAVGPALRRRWGRVQLAGADLELMWNGHMEGAVRAGERAAASITGTPPGGEASHVSVGASPSCDNQVAVQAGGAVL